MTQLQSFYNEIFIGSLHLAGILESIREELRKKSGIYGFLCKTTGKLYIGSSIDLLDRFSNHVKGSRSNILLQRAINKHNLQNFIFIVFEYCDF